MSIDPAKLRDEALRMPVEARARLAAELLRSLDEDDEHERPGALAAAAADVPLPPGLGHVYLLGEARVVSRLREVMAHRGLPGSQVSPKAYWGRGKANASHGEPAKDS